MSPFLVGAIILFGSFIFQVVLSPYLSISGVQPDLILIAVVIYAILEDPFAGSVAGFFGGLLEDLVSIRFIGTGALSKAIIGYFGGLLERTVFAETVFLAMAAIFIATILNQIIYMSLLFLVGNPVPLVTSLWEIVLPQAIYNSLISPVIYALLMRLVAQGERRPHVVGMLEKNPRIKS